MGEVAHQTPKAAAATVLRALDGLSVPSKLAVLALAGRVVHRGIKGSIADELSKAEVCVGDTWVTPKPHVANRRITLADGAMVGYETSRTRGLATVAEFAAWIRRHNARPMP